MHNNSRSISPKQSSLIKGFKSKSPSHKMSVKKETEEQSPFSAITNHVSSLHYGNMAQSFQNQDQISIRMTIDEEFDALFIEVS